MTVTKAQATAARYGDEFHYTGHQSCKRIVGPRGGMREAVTCVRVSGACKIWKTRPLEFRLPVKYGMYESAAIEHSNAQAWHSPQECPLQLKS